MIFTPRFVLRPLKPEDATERYSRWFDDAAFIVSARSPHDVQHLRSYIEARQDRDDVLFLGIFTRETGEHIGTIKYEPVDAKERYAVMGIFIGERSWRARGVSGEVIGASASWLRERHGIDTIVLGVDRDNVPAIKAFEKIGFAIEPSNRIPPRTDGSLAMVWHMDRSQSKTGSAA